MPAAAGGGALTLALEKEDGCFVPGETIRGELIWQGTGGGGGDQQRLREGLVVVVVSLVMLRSIDSIDRLIESKLTPRSLRSSIEINQPTQLSGTLHVEWEEGGHSGDDTGALRYSEDRVHKCLMFYDKPCSHLVCPAQSFQFNPKTQTDDLP
jgi:hypothetical protein